MASIKLIMGSLVTLTLMGFLKQLRIGFYKGYSTQGAWFSSSIFWGCGVFRSCLPCFLSVLACPSGELEFGVEGLGFRASSLEFNLKFWTV